MSPDSPDGKAAQAMIDYVQSESGGKITITPYWSQALLDAPQMASGIRDGVADMGRLAIASAPTEMPIANWFSGAGAVPPDSYPASNLVGVPTHIEMYLDEDLPFLQEFTSHGLVPLAMNSASSNEMICSRPVTTPEDLQGASARVPGEPWNGEAKALGISPVSIPSGELYEALQRGVIDCAVVSTTFLLQAGLFEVADTYLPLPMSVNTGAGLVINQEIWESLPAEAQEIIRDAAAIFSTETPKLAVEQRATVIETLEKNNVAIADMQPFLDLLYAQQERRLEEMVSDAPAGVDDAEGLLQWYVDSIERNSAALEDLGVAIDDDYSPDAVASSFVAGTEQVDWDGYQELILEAVSTGRSDDE
ncbi:TRAP transporter substrate-binding protein DctP [Rhodococcus sp. 5G237]